MYKTPQVIATGREEYVIIICEPGSAYFENVTPSSASSNATSKYTFEYLCARSVNIGSVEVVGCNEIVVNIERNNGVI